MSSRTLLSDHIVLFTVTLYIEVFRHCTQKDKKLSTFVPFIFRIFRCTLEETNLMLFKLAVYCIRTSIGHWLESQKERDHWEDQDVGEWTILKWILDKIE
jgi:hypothetical protein